MTLSNQLEDSHALAETSVHRGFLDQLADALPPISADETSEGRLQRLLRGPPGLNDGDELYGGSGDLPTSSDLYMLPGETSYQLTEPFEHIDIAREWAINNTIHEYLNQHTTLPPQDQGPSSTDTVQVVTDLHELDVFDPHYLYLGMFLPPPGTFPGR